jgi:probable HAF family extracellular repeat protein
MSTLRRVSAASALACVAVLGSIDPSPAAAPVKYALIVDEVRDLGTLSGHTWSEAHAINETGAIAGSSESAAGTRRAVWWSSPTALPLNLVHLGGGWSEAWGMNDANVVVGNSRTSGSTAVRGFRWTQGSGMQDLGLIGVTIGSTPVLWFTANDINNNGAIVGDFANSGGDGGYLLAWGAALVPPCPRDHALRDSTAKAINDDAYFTGKVHCIGGPSPSPYQGTLSAFTSLTGFSEPTDQGYAINAAGRVAGGFRVIGPDSEWLYHAFRWSSSAGFTDIHPPDDTVHESVARGINENGLIVGSKYTNSWSKAFVYGQGIQMTTLPDLCPAWLPQSRAYAVNDSGWIVGASQTCSGAYHATLWKVRVVVVPFPMATMK